MPGYRVLIEDGPAEGFSYWTAIYPERVIFLVPNRPEVVERHGAWLRIVAEDAPDWPGAEPYRLRPLGARLDGEDTIVPFRHLDEAGLIR